MTRQLEVKAEQRETAKRDQLVKVLEYGMVGALQSQGIELLGFSFKYDAFNCLMTLRADIQGKRRVCHVGSDSIINCFLKCESDARRDALCWLPDRYHPD